MLVSYQYVEKYLRVTPGEFYAVILFSLAGMMLMGSTGELITIYISLELTSIPLYILAGLSRTRRAFGRGRRQVCPAGCDVLGDSALRHGIALRGDRHAPTWLRSWRR